MAIGTQKRKESKKSKERKYAGKKRKEKEVNAAS
jgi:hypothetical protein